MPLKFKKYLLAAFIILPMSMVMGFVGVFRNYGLNDGWFLVFLSTWATMFPIAYFAAMFIIPVANKLIEMIEFKE